MTYGSMIPDPPEQRFVPRVFGFRVHSSAADGAFARGQQANQQQQQQYQQRLQERRRLRAAETATAAATATSTTATATTATTATTNAEDDGTANDADGARPGALSTSILGVTPSVTLETAHDSGSASAGARVTSGVIVAAGSGAGAGAGCSAEVATKASSLKRNLGQGQSQGHAAAAVTGGGVGGTTAARGVGVRVKVMGVWVDEETPDVGATAASGGREEVEVVGKGKTTAGAVETRDGEVVQGRNGEELGQASRIGKGVQREINGCSAMPSAAGELGRYSVSEAGEAAGAGRGAGGGGHGAIAENGRAVRCDPSCCEAVRIVSHRLLGSLF